MTATGARRRILLATMLASSGAALGVVLVSRGSLAARPGPAITPPSGPGAAIASTGATLPGAASAHVEPEGPDDGSEVEAPPPAPIPPRPPGPHGKVPFEDGMFLLPGGKFVQGSRAGAPNERPPHAVTIAPFWIDRTEVTVGAYRACVTARTCARPARPTATCTYERGDAELPVSCVHWADADEYCRFAGKRLPSESEWEFAARGTTAARFPWNGTGGNCFAAVTLIHEATGRSCSPEGPKPVGTHPQGASLFGVLDLSGNVEEWTRDWYTPTAVGGLGTAPQSGASHVLRGGGWMSPPSESRTTSRDWGSTLEAGANVGFRCARDVKPAR